MKWFGKSSESKNNVQKDKITAALIDYDIIGWGNDNEQQLFEKYSTVFKIGTDPAPKSRTSDGKIGTFCKDHSCVLFTADKEAYTHFFEDERIKTVEITKYAWYKEGDKPVYLVKIK